MTDLTRFNFHTDLGSAWVTTHDRWSYEDALLRRLDSLLGLLGEDLHEPAEAVHDVAELRDVRVPGRVAVDLVRVVEGTLRLVRDVLKASVEHDSSPIASAPGPDSPDAGVSVGEPAPRGDGFPLASPEAHTGGGAA